MSTNSGSFAITGLRRLERELADERSDLFCGIGYGSHRGLLKGRISAMIPNVLRDKREPCRQIFQVMETEY